MPSGISLQAQAPGSAGADLGFWLSSQIIGQPMAMTEQHLANVVEMIAANRFTLPRNRKTGARITEKGTAIVEVHGMLIDRAPVIGSFWGLCAYEGLAEQFRRLATHPDVKRIVLDIDSPGGMVRGIEGCSEELERLAAKKPVHAIAHNQACSAAYWIGCVAETFSVAPGGDVGSIGVRSGHVSYAEQLDRDGVRVTMFSAGATKTDKSPYRLLSDGEHAEEMFAIERMADKFFDHVAANRPLTADAVQATDARCFAGADAVAARLADRVESLEDMIERLEAGRASGPKRKAKASASIPGSKAGAIPPERDDPEDDPEDDETVPAVGRSNLKGASLMSDTKEPAANADISALITSALQSIAKPAAAAPAAAAPAVDATQAAVDAAMTRVFAILDSDEGKARPKLAAALARSGLSADAAKGILAAAAVEASAAAAAPADAAQFESALDKQMKKPGNAAGVKPEASAAKSRPSFVEVAAATAKKG